MSKTQSRVAPFDWLKYEDENVPHSQKAIENMMRLVCALVGVKGNAFPVTIDASESVGDLKKTIKNENEKTITCDADEL